MGHETRHVRRSKQMLKHPLAPSDVPHVPKSGHGPGGDMTSVDQGRQAKRRNAEDFNGGKGKG